MEETIGVDGINVCYEVEGEGEPMLLVHGMGFGRRAWAGVIAGAARSFRVYAPDLPGFGGSDAPDIPYSVPFYMELLNKLMHQLGLERAIVAGTSMGGAVAASLAASHPDKVGRLVLVAPAGLTPPEGEFVRPSRLMDAEYWLLAHNKDHFLSALQDLFYDRKKLTDKMADEAWAEMRRPEHRRALLRNAQYLAKPDPDFPELVASIEAPTLIVWGEQDKIVPAADAEKFAKLIQRSEVRYFPLCGHAVPAEQGGKLTDVVLEFLGKEVRYE